MILCNLFNLIYAIFIIILSLIIFEKYIKDRII